MERITSRKNSVIQHMRSLAVDRSSRRAAGEFLCDGEKLLQEALQFGAEVRCVLWCEGREKDTPIKSFSVPPELLQYVSVMDHSPGPVFSVSIPKVTLPERPGHVLVLENVQDPGNVGTVLRTASAFGIDLVVLTGACADVYNPKTVRSTMGALFRQNVTELPPEELTAYLRRAELPLLGAALQPGAGDIRGSLPERCAVAIGNEGHGLSREMLGCCDKTVIIPMEPCSESLNASVAASLFMWEMVRNKGG